MSQQESTSPKANQSNLDPGDLLYDSFLIRIWHHRGRVAFSRAEVRHVQTGKASTTTDVEPGWIGRTILPFLELDHPRLHDSDDQ